MLRERERRKTLILIHIYLLTIEKYIYTRLGVLTTIHVTYINKERLYTINTLYSTINKLSFMNQTSLDVAHVTCCKQVHTCTSRVTYGSNVQKNIGYLKSTPHITHGPHGHLLVKSKYYSGDQ